LLHPRPFEHMLYKGTRQICVILYACIFDSAWQTDMYAGS
jgi:hypothetical protein